MPLDFRYHLASLTAVFGALIIGILLGVAMKEGPGITKQIDGLRKEFHKAEALRTIDEHTDRFNARTQPLMVRNRLLGRNIALVRDANTFSAEQVEPVRQALREAGANVVVEITLRQALAEVTPERMPGLYEAMGLSEVEKQNLGDLAYRLGADIGRGWTRMIPVLKGERMIAVDGEGTVPVSMVILLGGGGTAQMAERLDVPFLRGCRSRGLLTAAVEPFDAATSAIPVYRKGADITVDNIDRAAGRIALVLALATAQRGQYGYKETADDVVPELGD